MNVTLEHLYPTLNRQKRETRKAYMGFLIWAVQDPEHRSVRLAAKALGKSESLLRRWSHRWDWRDRLLGVDQPDIVVLCFLRNLIKGSESDVATAMHQSLMVAMPQSSLLQNLTVEDLQEKIAGGIVLEPRVVQPPETHLHVNLTPPAEAPDATAPPALATPEPEAPPEPASQVSGMTMAAPVEMTGPTADEVSADFEQMRKLIQLGRAYILGQLRERKVRVTMSDVLTLQKAAFLMYGGPTESFAVDFRGLGGAGTSGGGVSESVESYAVKLARESGDKSRYAQALRDDLTEQSALIDALISPSEPENDESVNSVDESEVEESAAK